MNRLPSIRRWGVAALTGVTLFGGLSIVGAGVASAATAPTVTATFTSPAAATTLPGTTAAATAGGALTLTVAGTPAVNDQIVLTLACPTSGTASFASAVVTSTVDTFTAAVAPETATTCSTLTLTATVGGAANPVLTVTPSYNLSAVTTQALSISGSYATIGLASTSFTVPTDANVSWYSVTSNIPAVSLTSNTATTVSAITISEPAGLTNGAISTTTAITLTLPAGDVWGITNATATAFGVTLAASPLSAATNVLTIAAPTAVGTGGAQITLNGLTVLDPGTPNFGAQNATIKVGTTTVTTSASVGSLLGTVTTIAGPIADSTVAAEFEAAYPGGNNNVVLATDAAHANGSDALAASYLEGMLGTGLLITPATTLGPDAQLALRLEGVKTVYVVGGPLAISPSVLAQIQALPAYNFGGTVATGSNIKVVGPIAGADGTAAGTAAAIATYFGAANSPIDLHAAYTAGLYNSTTGSASTTAPTAGALSTAFVVAGTDWQDAMTIAPLAFRMHAPVILNGPSTDVALGADAKSALTSLGIKQVIVVGGQLALQNTVEAQIEAMGISTIRIAGIDATDTAAKVANFALATTANAGLGWTPSNKSVLASHADYWSDALGAAALGGLNQNPIILIESPTAGIGQYTTAELPLLGNAGIYNLIVLGGPLAMPSAFVNTLLQGL